MDRIVIFPILYDYFLRYEPWVGDSIFDAFLAATKQLYE